MKIIKLTDINIKDYFYNYKSKFVYFENCRNYKTYKSYTFKVFNLLLWLIWDNKNGFNLNYGVIKK